jgi:hypothetical protein
MEMDTFNSVLTSRCILHLWHFHIDITTRRLRTTANAETLSRANAVVVWVCALVEIPYTANRKFINNRDMSLYVSQVPKG